VKPMLDNQMFRSCAALGAACGALYAHDATAKPLPRPAVAGGDPISGLMVWNPSQSLTTGSPFAGAARDARASKRRRHANLIERAIKRMMVAGGHIARLPYVYGGGHGSFTAAGYDCSGSVSYVLHAAGLLDTPLDSGGFESWGLPGPGKKVTVYANGGHAWMTINGRRFDTIALNETGTRWSSTIGSTDGYVVRHPRGF
jgi:cell wall-associated NlpC family hydrolase